MSGPLTGLRIIEVAGIGPGPFTAMMLSDLGAEVLRVDRASAVGVVSEDEARGDLLNRGRRSVAIDLKAPGGPETLLRLAGRADGLLEGFRPGVAERLGIGPDACLARNPRIVYGRMTGWGQDGPLATAPGHDINYVSLAGVLAHIGPQGEPPALPLNLIGDFGGGGMLLALGMTAALFEASRSGEGQVVDAAMVDGAALLMIAVRGMAEQGSWTDERGANLLDSGAHFYNVYETSDGAYISVGAIEPQFYRHLLEQTGLADEPGPDQWDRGRWPEMKKRLAAVFRTRTRAEWCADLEQAEVCFAPVLSMAEAPEHPHMAARGTFVEVGGVLQPGPAPRFSRTQGVVSRPSAFPGEHTDTALADWGFGDDEIIKLRESKVVG